MRYWVLVLMLVAQSAFGGIEIATECVELGAKKDTQVIKNRCSRDVFIFWCHDSSAKPGTRSTVCGNPDMGKYFTQGALFHPGDSRDNSLSMPTDAQISFGACFGRKDSVKILDDKGGYECRLPREASANEQMEVIQAAGKTAGEACEKALAAGKGNITLGDCACESKGKAHICRVQAIGPKSEISLINQAIVKLREELHESIVPEVTDPL